MAWNPFKYIVKDKKKQEPKRTTSEDTYTPADWSYSPTNNMDYQPTSNYDPTPEPSSPFSGGGDFGGGGAGSGWGDSGSSGGDSGGGDGGGGGGD